MIRGPEWRNIRDKIQAYTHWKIKDGFRVPSPFSGRNFKYKVPKYVTEEKPGQYTVGGEANYTLEEILGQLFCVYYDELNHPSLVESSTREFYERSVVPHFEAAKSAIQHLIQSTQHLKLQMLPRKLKRIVVQLNEIEPKSLERPSGELDEARFGRHVLTCPECVAFLHAIDGIWILAKQQAKREDAQREAQREARQQATWPGKVRRLRQSLGLSQQELADKLGVARVTV